MKKIDVLVWGVKHIAANYGLVSSVDLTEGSVCVFGGCRPAILNDVQMLCADLGVPRDAIWPSDFGIDIDIDLQDGVLQQEYVPTGMELWKRRNATIGEEA